MKNSTNLPLRMPVKAGAAIAASVLLIACSASPALADGQSAWRSETADGTTYKFCSSVSTEGAKVKAGATVKASRTFKSDDSARIKARLYDSGKTLVASSTWHKSTKGSTKLTASTPFIAKNGKSYLSRALVQLYNGKGYDEYSAKWSPASKKAPARGRISAFPTTVFKGKVMTYGTDFDSDGPGDSPNLVAAVAANGSEGYVPSEEINPVPKTSAEALADDLEASTRPVLVYSLSGEPLGVLPVG